MSALSTVADRTHIALHLAHRWFAFFEAPGADLDGHLAIFHPKIRLTGHKNSHLFAADHQSLAELRAIPDEPSSHHIVHSNYSDVDEHTGTLNMVIAYQARSAGGVHGSIISYQTLVEFGASGPRFVALDKTPVLSNTRSDYETSWAENRVLALVHADLGGLGSNGGRLRGEFGPSTQVAAHAPASEGPGDYVALVSGIGNAGIWAVHLDVLDDAKSAVPAFETITRLGRS